MLSKFIFLIVVSCVTLGHAQNAKLKNIQFLFEGYNLMKASPRPLGPYLDPGLTNALIFSANYSGGYNDGKNIIPARVTKKDCSGSCILSFKSSTHSGLKEHQDSLHNHVAASGNYLKASFTANSDWKKMSHASSGGQTVFTESGAQCCSYVAEINPFNLPPFDPTFEAGVNALATSQTSYADFIDYFGTHFFTSVTMGSRFSVVSAMTSSNYSSLKSQGINVEAAAGFDAELVSGRVKASSDQSKENQAKFEQSSTRMGITTFGSPPPPSSGNPKYDGSVWANQEVQSPQPLDMQISPLSDLMDSYSFPGISNISQVQAQLRSAIDSYCSTLQSQGLVSTCAAPPGAPPLPTVCSGVINGGQLTCLDKNSKGYATYRDQWGQLPTAGGYQVIVTALGRRNFNDAPRTAACLVNLGFTVGDGFKIVGASVNYRSSYVLHSPHSMVRLWGQPGSQQQLWATVDGPGAQYKAHPEPLYDLYMDLEPVRAGACASSPAGYLVGHETVAYGPDGARSALSTGVGGALTSNRQLMGQYSCYTLQYYWGMCELYFYFS